MTDYKSYSCLKSVFITELYLSLRLVNIGEYPIYRLFKFIGMDISPH